MLAVVERSDEMVITPRLRRAMVRLDGAAADTLGRGTARRTSCRRRAGPGSRRSYGPASLPPAWPPAAGAVAHGSAVLTRRARGRATTASAATAAATATARPSPRCCSLVPATWQAPARLAAVAGGGDEALLERVCDAGFRVVDVGDITQTDGEPLPDVRPTLLTGGAPAGLWDALAQELGDAGYALERGDCQGANGRTNYLTRTVTARDDVDDAQAVRTLIHELAHVWLHDPQDGALHRGKAEVEAESVAYIVSQVAGLHPDDYSLPYVAVWSGGDIDTVRSTANAVLATARRVLTAAGLGHGDGELAA